MWNFGTGPIRTRSWKPLRRLRPTPWPAQSYGTTLSGEESLTIDGRMTINVFSGEYVSIPLGLEGGVLSRAELDGKPARLSVTQGPGVGGQGAGSGGQGSGGGAANPGRDPLRNRPLRRATIPHPRALGAQRSP